MQTSEMVVAKAEAIKALKSIEHTIGFMLLRVNDEYTDKTVLHLKQVRDSLKNFFDL